MSNPDPRNVIFSTRFKYYLNYGTTQGSVAIPSTAYAFPQYKSYSLTIPLERTDDFSNVKLSFSHMPGLWFNFPTIDLVLDSNFSISTTGSYSANQLTLTFFVVNQSGGAAVNTATTVTAEVALFVSPD